MKHKITKNKGFSLAEIMVAIFIIGITSSAAFIVTSLNIRSQIVGQDYAIALNLAREGLEVVRAHRDSNWLYYSGSRRAPTGESARDHWNDGFDGIDDFGNDYNEDAVGIGNLLTEDVNYTSSQMSNYFIPIIDYNSVDIYDKYSWKLKYVDATPGERMPVTDEYAVYRLSDADGGLYIQDNTLLGVPPAGGSQTKFYRTLDIRFQESYDQTNCEPHAATAGPDANNPDDGVDNDTLADEDPPGDYNGEGDNDDDQDGLIDEDGSHIDCKLNANDNIVLVRSSVYWYDYQGNKLNVELDTTLSDWFRREDHT